ncbi:MAG: family 43 glycosylhydrolase [Lachnospiraceae bacterium]|nr:family 43 glycosylhydrolase [Butyrivibrio sp.]MCM1344861.1 family 43 glycosylhydrolase [Muribaculaceae bacterium]MCM1411774.1 family 43 glycosylhydrolase [Lachnospiraceae bacterium]
MKRQVFNPYLPSYEYVPDGEPHVFGDRLYVFGSHDAFGADSFCVNDYVCYSAPVDDLSDWKFHGTIYQAVRDPLNKKGNQFMNAPDVCKGSDGRYYLYYQLHLEMVTSVAVADKPEGPYAFYGYVKHEDGILYGKKKEDAYNFDPGMLVDDDGRVYMYTGFSPDKGFMRFVMGLRGGTYDGGSVVQLDKDMLTIVGKEIPTIPGCVKAKGTEFDGHGFFEASSPRKINGLYYLVYSSILSHELCYATAKNPVGPWKYGGTIVSIGDIGLPGVAAEKARNFTGNTHGGLVEVKGQWYVFYHRQTNRQKCARQGCAEKISIAPDGKIRQVEITSCGLNDGPLKAMGKYEARIACNLWGAKGTYAYVKSHHKEAEYPYFTQSGGDREDNPDQYIANMRSGSVAGFKYFDFRADTPKKIMMEFRGNGTGKVLVRTKPEGKTIAELAVNASENWMNSEAELEGMAGIYPLYFEYIGEGYIDFNSFTLKGT